MALIECKECGKQISDQARTCPGCGAPVNAVAAGAGAGPQVQQIEQTGKQYKAGMAIGLALMVVGLFVAVAGSGVGFVVAGIGLVVAVSSKGMAWWAHG